MNDAFHLYSPWIRETIYRKGWTDLRDVQKESADALFNTDSNVLITSGTASGKTEAALFPILTLIDEKPSNSIAVLYISPLKALINDQFERLEMLLSGRDFPIKAWHGDVSSDRKQKLMERPRGILQITPESLEGLLMRRKDTAASMFSDLRFVIIDEVHSFMGSDRGMQVICLLERLQRLIGYSPRRIALSATLSDYSSATSYISSGSGRDTIVVGAGGERRKLRLKVESIPVSEEDDSAFIEHLYETVKARKCLIFSNSRLETEATARKLKEEAKRRGDRDIFLLHHGSLSSAERERSERLMKRDDGAKVILATVTLELGIDIGDLDLIVQIGAPWSVSSFVQRLGRSGRVTGISEMLFIDKVYTDTKPEIPWGLLRMIAIIELYLKDRWIESPKSRRKPYSLLFEQTLSILNSNTSMTPSSLAREVLSLSCFHDRISQDEYRTMLRHLIATDILEQMGDGSLIIGVKGSEIVYDRGFAAVFQGDAGYSVMSKDGEVGTISEMPDVGDVFYLAGKGWKVVETIPERRICKVVHSSEGADIVWNGSGGEIDERIVLKMRDILKSNEVYRYLSEDSQSILETVRKVLQNTPALDRSMIPLGGMVGCYEIFPWTGTRELDTIFNLLKESFMTTMKLTRVRKGIATIIIESSMDLLALKDAFGKARADLDDAESFVGEGFNLEIDKYDEYIPRTLRKRAYIENQMMGEHALEIIREIGR